MKKKFLLNVICEAALEETLAEEVEKAGGAGFTAHSVRGRGNHGSRSATTEADRNIVFQVIGSRDLTNRLAKSLENKFFKNYAMVLYIHEVDVLRSEKF